MNASRHTFPSTAAEYQEKLTNNLIRTLDKILDRKLRIPLVLLADGLYPPVMRQAFAGAGYLVVLPVNTTLKYLMFPHSSNMLEFHHRPAWWLRLVSTGAQVNDYLHETHGQIRRWFIASNMPPWDHDEYSRFRQVMAMELVSVLKELSQVDLNEFRQLLRLKKMPTIALWQQMAEQGLL